jgi:formylglycine-generating enzyme required for sulfatase activity
MLAGCPASPSLSALPSLTPRGETRAVIVPVAAHPLVVDWSAADRAALQAAASRGLVVVRFDAGKVEPLFQCSAAGKYAYYATERKAQVETFKTEAELSVSLPLGAVGFAAALRATGNVSVAMNVVGTLEATTAGAARDELDGSCAGATHVVAALTVGAFEVSAGTLEKASASASGAVGGGSGHAQTRHEVLTRDGEPASCAQSTAADAAPPEGCGALLRIELSPLVEVARLASARACPPHSYWDGSDCVHVLVPVSVECPNGTVWAGASCVPRVDTTCPTAMHFEGGLGCVANASPPPTGGPMVHFAGGTFTMGDGARDSSPPHSATVGPFDLDTREVTAAEYRECVAKGKCPPPKLLSTEEYGLGANHNLTWVYPDRGDHPINHVSHDQARWYCEYVAKRLPSAAEWELAARGTAGRRYPWGSEAPSGRACMARIGPGTCPVGTPSGDRTPEGVLGLAGNVSEWTSTVSHSSQCDRFDDCPFVVKGGAYNDLEASQLRAARQRAFQTPFASFGFRCAR